MNRTNPPMSELPSLRIWQFRLINYYCYLGLFIVIGLTAITVEGY